MLLYITHCVSGEDERKLLDYCISQWTCLFQVKRKTNIFIKEHHCQRPILAWGRWETLHYEHLSLKSGKHYLDIRHTLQVFGVCLECQVLWICNVCSAHIWLCLPMDCLYQACLTPSWQCTLPGLFQNWPSVFSGLVCYRYWVRTDWSPQRKQSKFPRKVEPDKASKYRCSTMKGIGEANQLCLVCVYWFVKKMLTLKNYMANNNNNNIVF